MNYNASGSTCYNGIEANCTEYGRLYDWAMAMDISSTYNSDFYSAVANHKGICPSGWHIPRDAEWTTLINFVDSSTAASKLKASSGWNNSGNGTDNYGFSALPGGYASTSFYDIGNSGWWWSSDKYEYANSMAFLMNINYDSELKNLPLNNMVSNKRVLNSVRCVQN